MNLTSIRQARSLSAQIQDPECQAHRVHTEWQWPLSGVHSIMTEKLAQAGEGGGGVVHAHPLSPNLPSRCSVRSSYDGRYTPSISSLPICTRGHVYVIEIHRYW
jgi:hypothetical protein